MNETLLIAVDALEGGYGWMMELAALVALVFLFNFVLAWALKKLHQRFLRQHNIWKDSFVVALHKPLASFVWLIASVQLLNGAWQRFSDQPLIHAPHAVFKIGLIIAGAWFFYRWKRGIVARLIEKTRRKELHIDHGKIDAINKVLTLALYLITTLLLLEQLGGSMNTLIAFGGVSGLAIAFASQQIIANFFGGVMIYCTHPFAIGDWIKIPEKDVEGIVEEIGWYTTAILALDKQPIYIPNSLLTNIIVMNPSRMELRQFKEIIGIRYDDLKRVPQLLLTLREQVARHPLVDKNTPPQIFLKSFNTHSVDIHVTIYTLEIEKIAFARFSEEMLLLISRAIHSCDADFAIQTTGIEFPKGIPQPQ